MTTSYDDKIVARVRHALCSSIEVANATDKQILAAYEAWRLEGVLTEQGDADWNAFPRLLIPSVRREVYVRLGYTVKRRNAA